MDFKKSFRHARHYVRELLYASDQWLVRTFARRPKSTETKSTYDWTRPDYDFWRRAALCMVEGLEIAGLFIKPITNKVSAWAFGRIPYWKIADQEAQKRITKWWEASHPDILKVFRESLRLGDSFLVINPDLSNTVLPPDAVTPIVSDVDFTTIIGWQVEIEYDHPTTSSTKIRVVDRYFDTHREHEVWVDGLREVNRNFTNLIGRVPIVHVPNSPQAGGRFGTPETLALLIAFYKYNEIITTGVEGNKLQGQPTPVINFATRADLQAFWARHGVTETVLLPDGKTRTSTVVGIDLNELITLSNATFNYESPGSFTQDTMNMLELLFYMILEHSELPEFVFGNAIGASRASASVQMPVFIRFIELRQQEMAGWLKEINSIVMAYLSILEPGMIFDEAELLFDALDNMDGRLTLDTVAWAYREGLLDAETALRLAPVDAGDIERVLQLADKEREDRVFRRIPQLDPAIAGQIGAGEDDGGGDAVEPGEITSGNRPLAQSNGAG